MVLGKTGILEFIHQEVAQSLSHRGEYIRLFLKKPFGLKKEIIKIQPPVSVQAFLIRALKVSLQGLEPLFFEPKGFEKGGVLFWWNKAGQTGRRLFFGNEGQRIRLAERKSMVLKQSQSHRMERVDL